MASNEERLKLFAAALYEMRVLLQTYDGDDSCVRLAERLAYALHNDALNVIEGDSAFDVEASRRRIEIAQELAGESYLDHFRLLRTKCE